MAFYDKRRILSFLMHVIVILLVLEILGVGELIDHPVVIGAAMLSYYDLWVRR